MYTRSTGYSFLAILVYSIFRIQRTCSEHLHLSSTIGQCSHVICPVSCENVNLRSPPIKIFRKVLILYLITLLGKDLSNEQQLV